MLVNQVIFQFDLILVAWVIWFGKEHGWVNRNYVVGVSSHISNKVLVAALHIDGYFLRIYNELLISNEVSDLGLLPSITILLIQNAI